MNQAFLESVLAHTGAVVFLYRGDTTCWVSPGVHHSLGWQPKDLVGRTLADLLHEEDRTVTANIQADLARRGWAQYVIRFRHAAGHWVSLDARIADMSADPLVGGVLVTARDLTDAAVAEEALHETREALIRSNAQLIQAQKMDALGRLAGAVAHDMNNVLSAIRVTASLLALDATPGSALHDDLHEILDAEARGAALMRQLLTFSRGGNVSSQSVSINDVAAEMERMLARLLGPRVRLRLELAPDVPSVLADPGQIGQVIMNLVVNAGHATADSGGTVTLRTGSAPDRGPGTVVLAVEDNGVGMDAATVSRVFEPFFSTKGGGGTGLGLSTVFGIVRGCGGEVEVDSTPGVGSVFRVLLPAMQELAPTALPSTTSEAPAHHLRPVP